MGTHLTALECRYDGPIPPDERAAAIAADRAERAERRSPALDAAPAVTVLRPKPQAPAVVRDRMARAIAEIARLAGCCTEEDLGRVGFSVADIRAHRDQARAHAGALLAALGVR